MISNEQLVSEFLSNRCGRPDLAPQVFEDLSNCHTPIRHVQTWLLKRASQIAQPYIQRPELTAAEIEAAEAEAASEGIPVTTALWRAKRRKAFSFS